MTQGRITFTSGFLAGRTVRAELVELQKADMARKFAIRDRRPLDPPPILQLNLFEILNPGTPSETEREFRELEEASLGMVCQADLFRLDPPDEAPLPLSIPNNNPNGPSRLYPVYSVTDARPNLLAALSEAASSDRRSTSSATSRFSTGFPDSFSFNMTCHTSRSTPTPSNARIPVPSSESPVQTGPSMCRHRMRSSPGSEANAKILGYVGNQAITQSMLRTDALAANKVSEAMVLNYEGKDTIMFAFPDLSVRVVGNFALGYRVFHIHSCITNSDGTQCSPMMASCLGGSFRVYETKDFPGLQPSTNLSKLLALHGVKMATRYEVRRRPRD
ncbi:hypothetical protein K474DRAFT_986496 [Panus rudis PR-1116 ss-1]|nr:hypothetical protein K474DRAFT_986496 [Panus rudis PR-1116 ss-1]